ncbi:hypothetical protein DFH05DRAFT_1149025 [Lentinula detonsa]|uniref:Uncharacterized protein n=1 Tax=Lentinula detonsa TaxID=2804962 RepID=A0A9W8NZX7_9AGAR|nr:hypothetical protein DFH05DRAFT_1149025 [Lentinula detonsa]
MQQSSHFTIGTSSQKAAHTLTSDAASSTSSLPMLPTKRARKSSRPATAPAKEDVVLLPSLHPSTQKQQLNTAYANLHPLHEDDSLSDHTSSRPGSGPTTPFEPPNSNNGLSTNTHVPSSNMSIMQEPHYMLKDSTSHPENSLSSVQQLAAMFRNHDNSYDWAVFTSAYAAGRWDPHRTPNPPRSLAHKISPPMRLLGGTLLDTALGCEPGNDGIDEVEQDRTPTAHTPSVPSSERSPVLERSRELNESSHLSREPGLDSISQFHHSRNPFPSSSAVSRASHPTSAFLGQSLSKSLSDGASGEQPENPPQKAKAGLFLNLPNLLIKSNSSLPSGLEPSPASALPYNVALQSNALHSNMYHSPPDIGSQNKANKVHSPISTTSDLHQFAGAIHLPTTHSVTKAPTASRATTIAGYPSAVPASATAAHFSSSQLPAQFYSSPLHVSSSRTHDFPNAPALNAATLRLAGTHVNISPLALPSPEHELTDPMRTVGVLGKNVMVTVPGTVPEHDIDFALGSDEDGSPTDRVTVDGDAIGTNSADKDTSWMHSRNSSMDMKRLADCWKVQILQTVW